MLIGYARVSSQDQNLDFQIDALKKIGCLKIFTEKISSTNKERPALEDAISYMRKGDTLVVWKLDRLARSLKQLIETLHDFEKAGIELKSLTEAIDTSTPSGRLIFHIFATIAEFERSLIRERTKAALLHAKKNGKIGGRPKLLTQSDIKIASTLLMNENITFLEVAKKMHVDVSTLYRYFPGGRQALIEAHGQ